MERKRKKQSLCQVLDVEVLRVEGLPGMTARERVRLICGSKDVRSAFARAQKGILVNCDAISTGLQGDTTLHAGAVVRPTERGLTRTAQFV